MKHDIDLIGRGAPPRAPLPMPKQCLERRPLFFHLRAMILALSPF
jgi:hypothetical protein